MVDQSASAVQWPRRLPECDSTSIRETFAPGWLPMTQRVASFVREGLVSWFVHCSALGLASTVRFACHYQYLDGANRKMRRHSDILQLFIDYSVLTIDADLVSGYGPHIFSISSDGGQTPDDYRQKPCSRERAYFLPWTTNQDAEAHDYR